MKSINQFKKSLVLISLLTISFNETLLPQASVSQPQYGLSTVLKETAKVLPTKPALLIFKNPAVWALTGLAGYMVGISAFIFFAQHYPTATECYDDVNVTYGIPKKANAAQFSRDILLINHQGNFTYNTKKNRSNDKKHCFNNPNFSAHTPAKFDRLWCGRSKNQTTQQTLNNLSALLQKINQDPQLKANIKEITLHDHGLPYIKHKITRTITVDRAGFKKRRTGYTNFHKSNIKLNCSAIKIKCTNKDLCKRLLADPNLPII